MNNHSATCNVEHAPGATPCRRIVRENRPPASGVTGSWIVVDQLTGRETAFETGEEAYAYAITKQGELHPKYRRYYVRHNCQEF